MPDERPTCGAKTRKGTPCRSTSLYPNGRCKQHGGPSTGPKTWTQGGKYSKRMQEFISACKDRAANPRLLDVREKLAQLDETHDELLDRALAQGDTPRFREAAYARAKEVNDLLAAGDPNTPRLMGQLVNMLREGVARDRALMDAAALADRRIGRTVDVRRVMVTESNAISLQQMEDFAKMTFETIIRVAGNQIGAAIVASITDAWHGRTPNTAWRRQLAGVTGESAQGHRSPAA